MATQRLILELDKEIQAAEARLIKLRALRIELQGEIKLRVNVATTRKSKEKFCHGCQENRPRSAFAKMDSRRDGLQSRCKPCQAEYHQAFRALPKKTAEAVRAGTKTKFCERCSTDLPVERFATSRSNSTGFQSECRACMARRRKKTEQVCRKCERRKPLDAFFGPYKTGRYSNICRDCHAAKRQRSAPPPIAAPAPPAPPPEPVVAAPPVPPPPAVPASRPLSRDELLAFASSDETWRAFGSLDVEKLPVPKIRSTRALKALGADPGPVLESARSTTAEPAPAPKKRGGPRRGEEPWRKKSRADLIRDRAAMRNATYLRCRLMQAVHAGEENQPVTAKIVCGAMVFERQAVAHLADVHGLDASYVAASFEPVAARDDEAA